MVAGWVADEEDGDRGGEGGGADADGAAGVEAVGLGGRVGVGFQFGDEGEECELGFDGECRDEVEGILVAGELPGHAALCP